MITNCKKSPSINRYKPDTTTNRSCFDCIRRIVSIRSHKVADFAGIAVEIPEEPPAALADRDPIHLPSSNVQPNDQQRFQSQHHLE